MDWDKLVSDAASGNVEALRALLDCAYGELRQRAQQLMRGQPSDLTLQTTALLNSACERILRCPMPASWEGPAHFFNYMAAIMRRILCDHARARGAAKRPPRERRQPLDDEATGVQPASEDVLALSEALEDLEKLDGLQFQIVQLRFFAGLTGEEIATVLELTPKAVSREWQCAKAWLQTQLA